MSRSLTEVMTTEEFAKLTRKGGRRGGKYGVSDATRRTWRMRVYASRAEMQRAQQLHSGIPTYLLEVVEQPLVCLGEDTRFKPDFLVIPISGKPWYEDVKGAEPKEWRKIVRLWPKYARLDLHVLKLNGTTFETTEIVPGLKE